MPFTETEPTTPFELPKNAQNPRVTLEMQNGDKIVLELYYEMAPNTVVNFISLVSNQFYDGKVFHRAVPDFMIQGGSSDGVGYGGPGYSIKGEFSENGFAQNTLKHTSGVLSMARSGDPNSAGSQFFICDGDASHLDGKYAAFGKVVSGQEFVEKIASMPTTGRSGDQLVTPQVIKKATVETFSVKYPVPVGTKVS